MKSSLHDLITFLPLFCQLPTPSILRCNYLSSLIFAKLNTRLTAHLNSRIQRSSNFSCMRSSIYSLGKAPTEKTASTIVECWFTAAVMCLQHYCVATRAARTTKNNSLIFCARSLPQECLPSRCRVMNYLGFQASCHNMNQAALLSTDTLWPFFFAS
jgi:hypothetical protein